MNNNMNNIEKKAERVVGKKEEYINFIETLYPDMSEDIIKRIKDLLPEDKCYICNNLTTNSKCCDKCVVDCYEGKKCQNDEFGHCIVCCECTNCVQNLTH